MPVLSKELIAHFKTDNLYKIFSLSPSAKPGEIKKAYYQLSLKYHPDKVKDNKSNTTLKFQLLSSVYEILSDQEKRQLYDQTGEIDDNPQNSDIKDWLNYWRLLFQKVTTEDIRNFEKEYKGSEQEKFDVLSAYTKFKGDMTAIIDNVMCASQLNADDEKRFRTIIDEEIEKQNVPIYKAYKSDNSIKRSKIKKKAEKEAREAEEYAKEILSEKEQSLLTKTTSTHCNGNGPQNDNDSALVALIQNRKAQRDAKADTFLTNLEEKYCVSSKHKVGKKPKTKITKKTISETGESGNIQKSSPKNKPQKKKVTKDEPIVLEKQNGHHDQIEKTKGARTKRKVVPNSDEKLSNDIVKTKVTTKKIRTPPPKRELRERNK